MGFNLGSGANEMTNAISVQPTWTHEHSLAASREGWDIFETFGSPDGPWQVQRVDDPDEVVADATVTVQRLNGDSDAWLLVHHGKEAHHAAAREFIKENSPVEWKSIVKVGSALPAYTPAP